MDIPTNLDQSVLWGVEIWRLLVAVVIIFAGFLSRKLIVGIFNRYLKAFAEKSEAQWDDAVVELMPTPLSIMVQLMLWSVASGFLALPKKPVNFALYAEQGFKIALAFALGWTIFRLIDVIASSFARLSEKTDSKLDDQLVPLVRKTVKVVVFVTFFVMVVQNLGYSVTSLVASLGVGGLALALAAKDTIANLFGSVVVFTDRPFQVGDWVQFDGIEGTVEEVGFRTTRVRRFDKSLVTVPNQTFSTSPITNHSSRPIRRLDLMVGVTYETSAKQMRDLLEALRKLIKEHEAVDQSFHFVRFVELGDSALNVRIYCFSKSTVWTEHLDVQEDLLLQIMEIVQGLGLEMAFPTRTLYLRDEKWPQQQPN